jgi:hypothetical protein
VPIDDVATIMRRDIRTTKLMFTIMWNHQGFHVINQLRDCSKMNSEYDIAAVVTPLPEKFCSGGPEDDGRPWICHVDNCSVHTSAATEQCMPDHAMIPMPQPPYSPDLASRDFC